MPIASSSHSSLKLGTEEKRPNKSQARDASVVRVQDVSHMDIWKKAVELAHDDSNHLNKEELLRIDKRCGANSISAVIEEANTARVKLVMSKISYTTSSGKKIAVQERVECLLRGLQNYTGIIDEVVSTSEYAGIVWASMKFFLQLLWNKIEMLEMLEEVLARLTMTMAVGQVYESIYSECQELTQMPEHNGDATVLAKEMESALPKLYAAVLIFSTKAQSYFQSALKFTGAISAARPFSAQFQPLVENINKGQKTLEKLATLATFQTIKAPLETQLKKIYSQVLDTNNGIHALQSAEEQRSERKRQLPESCRNTISSALFLFADEEPIIELALEWLDAHDPEDSLSEYKSQRVQGTCEWILKAPEYQQWQAASQPENLWICGQSGTGKTMLASFLADYLPRVQGQDALVFFFRAGSAKEASPVGALSSLVLQLIRLAGSDDTDPALRAQLLKMLKGTVNKGIGFTNRGKTVLALHDLLSEMLTTFSAHRSRRVVVILDALDACSDPVALKGSPDSRLQSAASLIITSDRAGQESAAGIVLCSPLQMAIYDDIKLFVDAKLAAAGCAHLRPHSQEITAIIRRSNMFRYGVVLLRDLASLSPETVSERLASLKLELNDMQDSHIGSLPLSTPLSQAVHLVDYITLRMYLEYAEKQQQQQTPISQQQLSQAISSAWSRGRHGAVRELMSCRGGAEAASELLLSAAQRGHADLARLLLSHRSVHADVRNSGGRTPLSLAAQAGHDDVVEALLARADVDVNSQDNTDDTPLIWAAYYGRTRCVEMLLARPGIDPNIYNNYRDLALVYAIRYAFVDVVRLLLASPSIKVNKGTLGGNTAIHEAPNRAPSGPPEGRRAHYECLKLLLGRAELDVNVRRDGGRTALATATKWDFYDQVALLLTRDDVDRHPVDDAGETPLATAKRLGYNQIVALLS
ncbi:ankyrin repeat-containing protein [Grosmannia clavigera kw1407]|uniref:Ankyrin repeat-containing protein n=1 Tax=Grosmannia clavigera (strain kw1407 / UAMH 11150) TaxID=655863 RepID=F0XKW1_GROCL|nr:ankyrin repeat-containing protein [Grosmannia clavigera kw1407]EFX01602.1 ankyrin repeat-containing protein [Grosmannia clavigera kw1407]